MGHRRHGWVIAASLLVWVASARAGHTPSAIAEAGEDATLQTCRNIGTSATFVTAGAGFTATVNQTCTIDVESATGSCTGLYKDSLGTTRTIATISKYASVAAMVDEVSVIPPLTKVLSSSGTQTPGPGGVGSTTGSSVNTYDGQGRLTRTVGSSASGMSTTTFSAWDGVGRPTVATDDGPGFRNRRDIRYDDAARTRTTVVNGNLLTTVETFDANGNPTRQTTSGGGSGGSTTITTTATTRVCKAV